MPRSSDLLETTEQIADLLAKQGIEAIVIGAAAMVNIAVCNIPTIAARLRAAGLEAVCSEPGGQDPRELCRRYWLRGLEPLIREADAEI